MATWIMTDGESTVESKQITNTDTGTIKVYRREVLVTRYESAIHCPGFVWSATVAETTLFGDEDSTRCVRHGFRLSPITGKLAEYKEVVTPGRWKHVHTYAIEEATPPPPPPPPPPPS